MLLSTDQNWQLQMSVLTQGVEPTGLWLGLCTHPGTVEPASNITQLQALCQAWCDPGSWFHMEQSASPKGVLVYYADNARPPKAA